MPATLKAVLDRLYTTLAALATGTCDARTAAAMAAVATAIAQLYDQAETAPRLQALEDAAVAVTWMATIRSALRLPRWTGFYSLFGPPLKDDP
jgi:hypothetical protein